MKVLLVKMSSMGDVIHTLPALTDLWRAIPDVQVDWVIEPAFAEIPLWHPAVKKIIPIALRRWRKNIFSKQTWREIKNFFTVLREKKYDLVIDAQGLLKSALVTRFARGKSSGFDHASARESIASFFYRKKYSVDKNQHIIFRLRELFSKIGQYSLPDTKPDYLIQKHRLPALSITLAQHYVVFLHGTTWENKYYPEAYWKILLEKIKPTTVYLPWGNDIEKLRAEKLQQSAPHAVVLPKLTIAEMATVLKNAQKVIAVDTGLGHLCAALGTPTISLYGPTDPQKTGTIGDNQIHLAAHFPCAPCSRKTCHYAKSHAATIMPACYTTVSPEIIIQHWEK